MSKFGASERTRVLKIYTDPQEQEFRDLVDFWSAMMVKYKLQPNILEDAIKLASIFSAQRDLWDTTRRLQGQKSWWIKLYLLTVDKLLGKK